mgnify:CR=1 FL=1
MATAKTKFARMKQTAERLDWLMANARILRSPALWEKYYEALRVSGCWALRSRWRAAATTG